MHYPPFFPHWFFINITFTILFSLSNSSKFHHTMNQTCSSLLIICRSSNINAQMRKSIIIEFLDFIDYSFDFPLARLVGFTNEASLFSFSSSFYCLSFYLIIFFFRFFFLWLIICLFIYLFVYLLVRLFIWLSIYFSICLFCLFTYLLIYSFISS